MRDAVTPDTAEPKGSRFDVSGLDAHALIGCRAIARGALSKPSLESAPVASPDVTLPIAPTTRPNTTATKRRQDGPD